MKNKSQIFQGIKRTSFLSLFIFFFSFTQAQKANIGYIDRDQVFNDMPETKEALKTLEKSQKEYTDYIDQLKKEYKSKYATLKAKQDSLPKIIFQEKVDELNTLDKKITDFQLKAQKDLLSQKEKLLTSPKNKLNAAIEAIRKEKGYAFIIDNSKREIISSNGKFDIEGLVRKKLNLK